MNLFNECGTINTFDKVNDIFEMWYDVRLRKYDERKSYLIGKISNELDLLKYKALFIKYVLDSKIIVFRQKKQAIIDRLIELEFPMLSTSDDEKSYDYITSIPLFHLTLEKIEELNDRLKEKEEELDYVKKTTPIEFWKKELKEFEEIYKQWYKAKTDEFNDSINGNIKITKLNKKTSLKKKNKNKKKKVNEKVI